MEQKTFQELTDELIRLYNEARYGEAFDIVDRNADYFPEQAARTTFWKMCLLSLSGRTDEVLATFRKGLDAGLWWAESQLMDTDLDAVRELSEFKRLVAESHQKCIKAREQVQPDRTLLLPEETSGKLPLLIALHGRGGNKDSNLEFWEVARRRGWLVLSPQSRQALFEGSFCWDDSAMGLEDILFHVEEIKQAHSIDPARILVGGFSQGSGMCMYTALHGKTGARGFIGIGTWWQDPSELALAGQDIRGYFVTGEKDHTLDRAREIQQVLKQNNINFVEEVHADLGHAFPADFERAFDEAIDFIFEEHE